MKFRTTFDIEPFPEKITYNGKVMLIGSCFATYIAKKFDNGHIPAMVNPSGTVYNPVSVINTLDTVTGNKKYTISDLYFNEGTWISFEHYTDFSGPDPVELLKNINSKADEAKSFMSEAGFLFVTFGTARVYRWKESRKIVSNCHKIPASMFTHELLKVQDIVDLWSQQLDRLKSLYPGMKVIFTISPVRHLKDGAYGNQVSKSVLFLAVEELMKHSTAPGYFPAYELLLDDLRDYRFYDEDMLHPSSAAVDYIWEAFTKCYFSDDTLGLYNDITKITRAISHRIRSSAGESKKKFAMKLLEQIASVTSRAPHVNLENERAYFAQLLGS